MKEVIRVSFGYNYDISRKSVWNNCLINNNNEILLDLNIFTLPSRSRR